MKKFPETMISENQKTWDIVADAFVDASALPVWGPFGVGEDLNLIPKIQGSTFLEIGCGSGRSIKYLTEENADKVYGLDLSTKQVEEATSYNHQEILQGKVQIIQGPMEEKIDIEPVDIVFSIYAIGWTPEPEKTLKNIHSYLKPGGLFIWSWDHSFFADIDYQDKQYTVVHSYHNEEIREMQNWKREGTKANIAYRKTSSWFQLQRDAGFEVIGYHEPKPRDLSRGQTDPSRYYAIQKAEKVPCSFIFVCKKKA